MRTKKAMKNIIASMIYQIVSIICGLILPRLILSAFGSTYNGVISSATQFLSMVSLLNLGIAGATRVALYKTLAADDVLGTSRIMKATKKYMYKVGGIVAVYAAVLCIVYPFISHNDLTHIESAAIIAIISLSTFAEYFFGISNNTLLSADQSGYITSTLNIIVTIANTAISAILIKMGASIFCVKLAGSLVFFIAPFVLNIYVKKKYGLISDCEPDDSAIKGRKAAAFHSIANIVHNNTDLLVLTVFADAKQISVYSVYYLVVGKIKSIMSVFTNGLEAAFGNMWAKNELDLLKHHFKVLEFALYAFTAVIFSCVGILIVPFIAEYTKGVHDVNYILYDFAILISLAEGMYCIREPYLILIQATGYYEETKIGALIEALLNIFLSIILVNFIGINGVIIGTFVANTFRTFQYAVFIAKYITNESFMHTACRFLWLVANVAIIVIISFFILQTLPVFDGWTGWIRQAAIVLIIACVVTLISSLAFYKNNLMYLFGIFMRMISKRS